MGRLKKLFAGGLVGLLLVAVLLTAVPAAAEGNVASGVFPDRVFNVIRSPPGGPHSDTWGVNIDPTRSGNWWVTVAAIPGSGLLVEVYEVQGGVNSFVASSKLKYVGDASREVAMVNGGHYWVDFTPYGTKGTVVLNEHFTTPSAPVASFTFSPSAPTTADTVSFDASASTDVDQDIASYSWNFGDGAVGSGVLVDHQFAAERDYTVVLSVADGTGLIGTFSDVVSIVGNKAPVAIFSAVRDLMTVSVDASASYDSDGAITDFSWDWGDGGSESTGTTATASHTYAAAGSYEIGLVVTDDHAATGAASHDVSVNTWTVDWSYHDFFNVPFGEWWDMRTFYVGDRPILAECFSAEGIANGWCMPVDPSVPDVPSYPYTYWSPSPVGDAMIYAPYEFDAAVKNAPAFTMDQPVLLPTCADLQAALTSLGVDLACPETPPAGGSVSLDESFQYLTTADANALLAKGCPDLVWGNDGFMTEVQLTVTMDSAAAARLFGVTSSDQWASLITPGCGPGDAADANSGPLEQGLAAWLTAQGNGPYAVYNAFGNAFTVFAIDASASSDPVAGTQTLTVDLVTWGFEVLTARWFYWGATAYTDGVGSGAAPTGFAGMEMPWLEGFQMSATIGTAFSASMSGAVQYHFRQFADAGPNGLFDKTDDVPKWTWAATLGDRLYGSAFAPASELNALSGSTYVHVTAGSSRYGSAYAYDYVPAVWALKAGQTQTFAFPTDTVALYDPFWSPPLEDPLALALISSAITLAYSVPGTGVGTFDAATGILLVVGPTVVGTPPTTAGGAPLQSRPSYNLLKA